MDKKTFLSSIKQVDVFQTGDVNVFDPEWKFIEWFAIADSAKENLAGPIGIVQPLPLSNNLEVTFKTKDGKYSDFYLDPSTQLQIGTQVHIDDLIGEHLKRDGEIIARYLHILEVDIK